MPKTYNFHVDLDIVTDFPVIAPTYDMGTLKELIKQALADKLTLTLYCPNCDGTGEEGCDECDERGYIEEDCPDCDGTGEIDGEECANCEDGAYIYTCDKCNGECVVNCSICNGVGKAKTLQIVVADLIALGTEN